MSLFKCKMCGGDLEISEGVTIAECEYCGTKQTVPKAMDENLQNLFNRANTLRIKSEFDKAEKLYEKIIQADAEQAEAYWGLILCKYGIEYVDDPATYKKIPTCHRASYDSIIADDDYKSALQYADTAQRAIYEEQAKEIDRIQKDILAIAQNEEKYDVFICYKETDADGKRTQDSVIANDIYYQLTQEGFKVFYAAITLEDKLGSAYEPIIFAALNSSKVMLSIGTKPEYFNAVWVKNEWSRFLKMMKNDRSKMLIPCYKGMDAYELPEEFAHLQAQDMSKIGFINDIVRGIKKVIKKDEPKATVIKETIVKETIASNSNDNVTPLLKRAFMFIEDGNWGDANEYCEKVLDIDPENAQAYLGKLMADLKVNEIQKLKNCARPLDSNSNYQKCIRFGDDELKNTLNEVLAEWKSFFATFEYEKHPDGTFEVKGVLNDKIESAEIPGFVTKIGEEAFSQCQELASVTIPASVTYIGPKAFSHCRNLTSITIYTLATDFDSSTFEGCDNLTNLIIGDIAKDYGRGVPIGNLTCITINENNTEYRVEDNCLIDNANNVLTLGCKNGFIPNTVTEIGEHAFYGRNVSSVIIPNNITGISDGAFSNCYSLASVVIPDSVTDIGDFAFNECKSLISVKMGDGVTKIGNWAFADCRKLTSITIPDSVIHVGIAAFRGCYESNLTENGKPYEKPLSADRKPASSGCYVATCVYGSYDCPEVWTLRRFRDDTLGSTWYGRAFIHTYYAISPTLVKWFGHTEWFKKMWRGTLDKMVNKLNSQGVEDTPYNDKTWRK